ncbi:cartilage intermediate layer protein 1-like [Amphiura filiformis]|uniref:cartilage intermediate layer protein 1-like n=1 Tax=Amphiura filiformis TaxID=82378 RepID=UPI003B2141A1
MDGHIHPKASPNKYDLNQFQNPAFQSDPYYETTIKPNPPEQDYSPVEFPRNDDDRSPGRSKRLICIIVIIVCIVLVLGITLGIVFGIVLPKSESSTDPVVSTESTLQPSQPTSAPLSKPVWTTWGSWSDCDVECGGGVQNRSRTCPLQSGDISCAGKPTEQQQCKDWKCPDCEFVCQYGVLNTDCDACECTSSILNGRVMDENNRPLSDAKIYYSSRPYKELVTTNSTGLFEIIGVCSTPQMFLVSKQMFTSMEKQSTFISPTTSSLYVTLQRIELPYISVQPENKIRHIGDSVGFCCLGDSVSPIKKFEWFQNGDIIETALSNGDSLIIDKLDTGHAGTYTCRVENEMGAVYSEPAILTVIDSTTTSCNSEPGRQMISLPSDCVQPDTNRAEYNVGTCGQQECLNASKTDQTSCLDSEQEFFCCQPVSKIIDLTCNGYTLPVSKVISCGCGECIKQNRKIIGRVVAADSGEPLGTVPVYYNSTEDTRTSPSEGLFSFVVPSQVRRVALTLKDEFFKRVIDTTVVFEIGDSLVTYHVFRMKRVPVPIMVEDSSVESCLPLVSDGSEQVAELVLAPNSMYDSDGEMYQGSFNVNVMNIDMRNVTDAEIAPGDFAAADAEGNLAELKSYGMFAFSFTDMSDNPLSVGGSSVVRVNQDMIPSCQNGTCDTSLWVFNERSGTWEMASPLRDTTSGRKRRQNQNDVNGEIDVVPFTWYNIDAFVASERCWAKVAAYTTNELNPTDGLLPNNYMVTSIIEERGNSFLRRNSPAAITTNGFGVCVAQGCDSTNPNDSRFTTHLTASYLENTLTPAAYPNSSPFFSLNKLNPSDFSKLQYETMGNQLSMKPYTSNDGPVFDGKYSGFSGGACVAATADDIHFQFYCPTCDGDDVKCITVNSVAPNPSRLTYQTFYPALSSGSDDQDYCFIGIRVITSSSIARIIVTSEVGGLIPGSENTFEKSSTVYGTRELRARKDNPNSAYIDACMEYKCSGQLFNPLPTTSDTTKIIIDIKVDTGSCMVTNALQSGFETHLDEEGISVPAALPFTFPDSQTHGLNQGLHTTNNVMNLQECVNDPNSPQTSNTKYCVVNENFVPCN